MLRFNGLCDFAHCFTRGAAELLEVGSSFKRNVREETITDLLMVGLKQFEHFGIRVDFPQDESITGQDMDWEFVAPHALDDRKYVRLHIQAKRAKLNQIKDPYWWYPEIDHASPKGALKGTQHKSLIDNADLALGCIPLYMFYHPQSSLKPELPGLPAIEGVNILPANLVPQKTSKSLWLRAEKKVETLRPNFSPLSKLLCPHDRRLTKPHPDELPGDHFDAFVPTPGKIVDVLNERFEEAQLASGIKFATSNQIPDGTVRAISSDVKVQVERPRVLFLSQTK